MNRSFVFLFAILIALSTLFCSNQKQNLKLLIVTGGHDFRRDAFFAMFNRFENMQYKEAIHPTANKYYAADSSGKYDVLVFYDMNQEITDKEKKDFIHLVRAGKGLVFLHHSLANYQQWDEFLEIIGGRYLLKAIVINEKEIPASTAEGDLDLNIRITDPEHPVTKGLEDFTIHDEAYGGLYVSPTVHPLLGTDHAESAKIIAWANSYGKSRIVTIQTGHSHICYENENYQKLVRQAIAWVAGKE